jgi:hypothetical protein
MCDAAPKYQVWTGGVALPFGSPTVALTRLSFTAPVALPSGVAQAPLSKATAKPPGWRVTRVGVLLTDAPELNQPTSVAFVLRAAERVFASGVCRSGEPVDVEACLLESWAGFIDVGVYTTHADDVEYQFFVEVSNG